MSHEELSKRENWQTLSGNKALDLESAFYTVFDAEFNRGQNKNLKIRKNPSEFKNIYSDVALSNEVEVSIFKPDRTYTHGINIDFAIDNTDSGKTIYVEIKRQDGWVEDLPMSAGRGNAHERLCKFFTPGLLHLLRKYGRINRDHLPFWVVFGGNITRDPKRVREITFWFEKYRDNFFMWRYAPENITLIRHFDEKIKPLIS